MCVPANPCCTGWIWQKGIELPPTIFFSGPDGMHLPGVALLHHHYYYYYKRRQAPCHSPLLAAPAWAQSPWPSKSIKIIVPYTSGGFTDQMARVLQVGLQKQRVQSVVIDNKPGAKSIIGVDAVAKSAPDGYTFGVVIPAFTANTTLYPKLPYDAKKDLVGVSLLGVSPLVAAVSNNAPFKNTRELVAYAKANPGKVSFASSASEKRLPILPDVPTFVEQGIPGMLGSTWASMIAPAATPRDIVKRMSEAVNQIIHSEETRAKLEAMGAFTEGTTPEACDAFMASETAKWGKVIRDAGVTLE